MEKHADTAISTFSPDDIAVHVRELGALMHACVHDGASIGYILPFSADDAEAFWKDKVLSPVRQGTRVLLVAHRNGRIVGSVQLDTDTPPNQPHRAEVRKLLVHPDFRRQGIGKALMGELEYLAGRLGRNLLTLDTRTGDHAEPLYTSLGYRTTGVIPGYCLDPFEPHFDSTTIMYKALGTSPAPSER